MTIIMKLILISVLLFCVLTSFSQRRYQNNCDCVSLYGGVSANYNLQVGILYQDIDDFIYGVNISHNLYRYPFGEKREPNIMMDENNFINEGWTPPVSLNGLFGWPIFRDTQMYVTGGIGVSRYYTNCIDTSNKEWKRYFVIGDKKIKANYGIGFKTELSEYIYLMVYADKISKIGANIGITIK